MNDVSFGITWGAWQNLIIVIPLVIVVVFCLLYRFRRSKNAVDLLAKSQWRTMFVLHFSLIKSVIKICLFVIGISFLSFALLQPQWNKKEEMVAQEGRDLFIALDISRSMLAKDCLPNRLECAKAKIKELVKKLSCERVGLLLFSGSAFVQCPLTSDYGAFYMFLDQVDVETISSGSTAFDQAIKRVIEAYAGSEDRKNKLVVLFTDGEDFSSNLSNVKEQVQQEKLHIFTMGIGTADGAPIPMIDESGKQKGHQLDRRGSVVISRLNEGILYALAQDSGGSYIRMTKDDSDLRALVSQVQKFEKEKFDDKKVQRMEEQYPYFVFVSFMFLLVEWLL